MENDDNATPPCVDAILDGLLVNVFQSAEPPLGKPFILLASKFPENDDNATPLWVDVTHDGLLVNVFQSAVPPLVNPFILLTSKFP
jgi:hypothetical protein